MDCLKFSKESDKSKSSKKKLIGLGPKSKLKHSRSRETTNAAPKMESKPAEKSPEAACAMIPNGFTDVDREEMKQAFDLFDKNHDGKISSEELGCVLRTLGWEYTQVEVEEMIKNADTNENGFVEYDEFLVMMKKWSGQASLPSVDEKTREAFRVFDMDGNGYIDKHELRYVMRRLGENLSEDDIRDMFKEADLNEDGKIDFNDLDETMDRLAAEELQPLLARIEDDCKPPISLKKLKTSDSFPQKCGPCTTGSSTEKTGPTIRRRQPVEGCEFRQLLGTCKLK